jgi:glucan phosphoethanolaminetransferase (alkaline phosphatase superfamily)
MAKQSRFITIFVWFVLSGTLFIVNEVLHNVEVIHNYHMYWLDVASSYALLGSLGIIAALIASVLLAGLDRLALRYNISWLQFFVSGIIFAAFAVVWLNILRQLLFAAHIKLTQVPPVYQLAFFFILGLVVFICFPKPITEWMTTAVRRLRPIVWAAVVIFVVLTACLFLEQLNKGNPAPVILKDPNRALPNIIIIVLDSLTSRDMSLYGYDLPTTPNLDRIAKKWTVYENAHSTGTGTLSFVPSVFTGRYPYTDDWYK